ncbi:hypothetical protein EV44_g1319 [Erysiphe necator]|uniref:Mediator complex subunit 15 KIX domain-containing protein n=1 Tax=Uncinula necator TaxID=52586 RepID=A0A0B1P2H6_UNCNE|nr:hypothetical protein EV44_g1319 [Erysiphe necator]
MAANFQQQINGSAPMISQQMAQQQQQQRAQQSNFTAQIHQFIYSALQSQQPMLSGWRASAHINERLGLILAIITALRNASQHISTVTNIQKIIEMALKVERDCLMNAPTKEGYKQGIKIKIDQLQEKRSQQTSNFQHVDCKSKWDPKSRSRANYCIIWSTRLFSNSASGSSLHHA